MIHAGNAIGRIPKKYAGAGAALAWSIEARDDNMTPVLASGPVIELVSLIKSPSARRRVALDP